MDTEKKRKPWTAEGPEGKGGVPFHGLGIAERRNRGQCLREKT